jgi:hypothetical protein
MLISTARDVLPEPTDLELAVELSEQLAADEGFAAGIHLGRLIERLATRSGAPRCGCGDPDPAEDDRPGEPGTAPAIDPGVLLRCRATLAKVGGGPIVCVHRGDLAALVQAAGGTAGGGPS